MTLKKIAPSNIEDISVSVALGRPGAMRFINEYSQVKKGEIKKEINASLADILKPTQGFIVFQEQIMKLSQKMANFSPKEADGLRKGIGKKIKEKVLEYKEKFIANSLKNGYSKELVNDIWKSFEDSADYSFNKSHAVSYGYLTAYTAYLKANHPLEFFTACLNQAENERKPLEEISKIKAELSSFNIRLLPPSLKSSSNKFTIESGGIRFPLSNIKGITKKTCENLTALRGDFKHRVDIFKAATIAKINKTTLFGLIMAGALDEFISSQRVLVMAEAAFWRCLNDAEQDKILELSRDNDESIFELFKKLKVLVNDKGKLSISERRLNTINKGFDPYKKMYNQNKIDQDITKFYFETKLLGFAYTKSLQEIYNQKGAELDSITDIKQGVDDESFRFIGIVTEKKTGLTKAGNDYLKLTVEGHDGIFGAMLFNSKNNKKIDQHEEINGRIAEEDDVVIVSGKKKGDVLFADNIGIQKIEVYEKLRDIIANEDNQGVK
jgi:DNA polymerase III alpha subunit